MEPLDRNSQLQWHDEHKVIRLSTDHERSHHSMWPQDNPLHQHVWPSQRSIRIDVGLAGLVKVPD